MNLVGTQTFGQWEWKSTSYTSISISSEKWNFTYIFQYIQIIGNVMIKPYTNHGYHCILISSSNISI